VIDGNSELLSCTQIFGTTTSDRMKLNDRRCSKRSYLRCRP